MQRHTQYQSLLCLAACVPVLGMCGEAFGWGYEEHKIIAVIGERYLTDAVRHEVADLLGISTADAAENRDEALALAMAEASVWADEIKKSDPTYDWAKPLHYLNLPPNESSYERTRDCPDNMCVVEAISYYAGVLQNHDAPKPVRAEALRFLIHFVGDIHQPLHAGNAQDQGGNRLRIRLFGESTNLHAAWDYGMTQHARLLSSETWQDCAKRLEGEQCGRYLTTLTGGAEHSTRPLSAVPDPGKWANESRVLALTVAYPEILQSSSDEVSEEYVAKALPIAEERLAKAGVRLAETLNHALGQAVVYEQNAD